MKETLPSSITIYLDEIAERLWMKPSHACVLVGAGFSKNAIKADESIKTSPSWHTLAGNMLNQLYGTDDVSRDFLDVLNVADEFQATYGKISMDQFLERNIPDESLRPSELHKQLMSLPWADVLTTNYDTLLERATDTIVERNYDRVINKDKLVLSHSPRIIKLHGSFPAQGPYVISAEDYRRYPVENAILVNTVQQALIENTLCMVGFSGDDPNFNKWIGWIRDNLGENVPKMYMIGYHKFSLSKINLLKTRNIIPIDIAPICQGKEDIPNALMKVFKYLQDKNDKSYDWGIEQTKVNEDVKDVLLRLREQRLAYPGWKIVPFIQRARLREQILQLACDCDIEAPNDIAVCYEYNWLYEKTLLTLDATMLENCVKIVAKYVPFVELDVKNDDAYTPMSQPKWSWSDIGNQWINLQLALLRAYREQGEYKKWEDLNNNVFHKIKNYLVNDFMDRYYYELCLNDAYHFNLEDIKQHIQEWSTISSSSYWKAKRASLIGEFINLSEARTEMHTALLEVRKAKNLVPIRRDYDLISTESIILFLLGKLNFAYNVKKNKLLDDDRGPYTERMRELRTYDCDPSGELNYLKYNTRPLQKEDLECKTPAFDLNKVSYSIHFGDGNPELALSIQYLRFLEEVSCPMCLPNVTTIDMKSFVVAVQNVSRYYPHIASVAVLRAHNNDLTKETLTRKYLSQMKQGDVEEFLNQYLLLFDTLSSPTMTTDSAFVKSSIFVVPEIISRLITKASYESRIKVLNSLTTLYGRSTKVRFQNLDNLVRRLINSFTNEEQMELIPKLIKIPFPIAVPSYNTFGIEPFSYIRNSIKCKDLNIDPAIYDMLCTRLTGTEDERRISFVRLYKMFLLGQLPIQYKRKFGEKIWNNVDKDCFPAKLPYFDYIFLELPHPKNVIPAERLRKHIMASDSIDKEDENALIIGYNLEDSWANILGSTESEKYHWQKDDVVWLCNRILKWWKKNKFKTAPKYEQYTMEFNKYRRQLHQLIDAVRYVIYPNLQWLNQMMRDDLSQMAIDIAKYAPGSLYMRAILSQDEEAIVRIKEDINRQLAAHQEDFVLDACNALVALCAKGINVSSCISTVAQAINFNKVTGRVYLLNIILFMLKNNRKFTPLQDEHILHGLDVLLQDVSLQIDDSELLSEEKIAVQVKCVEISCLLFLRYTKSSKEIPNVIQKWIDWGEDENEFVELKNIIKEYHI